MRGVHRAVQERLQVRKQLTFGHRRVGNANRVGKLRSLRQRRAVESSLKVLKKKLYDLLSQLLYRCLVPAARVDKGREGKL